jgi:hypothetical protein
MVGGIKYRRADPNRKGRGAGYYYHRGNGVYSKYSTNRDKEHKKPRTRFKGYNWRYGHTGDGTYSKPKKGKSHYGRNRTMQSKMTRSKNV